MHPNRRVLAGTVIAVALLLLGACSKSDNTATTGTTAGTTGGTAAPGTPASKAAVSAAEPATVRDRSHRA